MRREVLRTRLPISNAVAAVRNERQFHVVYPASGVAIGSRPSCLWTRGEYYRPLGEAPACVIGDTSGKRRTMLEFSARASGQGGRLRQVAAWIAAAVVYGAAQGLSTWVARYAQGRGTRPQYEQFQRPAFAPPGAVFPVVWSALNLTTATSAWLVWRADEAGPGAPPRRRAVLEWWRWPLSSAAVTCRWHSAAAGSGRPPQIRRCCALSW